MNFFNTSNPQHHPPSPVSFSKQTLQNPPQQYQPHDQMTPKPSAVFGGAKQPLKSQEYKGAVGVGLKTQNLNSNAYTPFPHSFQKDMQQYKNKKRQYSEIFGNDHYQRMRATHDPSTPYYTFDDNSTIKPNDNTIIRNPQLINLGFGKQQEAKFNRSHMVNPMNLSKTQFIEQQSEGEEDSYYYSAFDATPFNPKAPAAKAGQSVILSNKADELVQQVNKLTIYEVQAKCMNVSQIVQEAMDTEADLMTNDIGNGRTVRGTYEIAPFQFVMTHQHQLPTSIIREMNEAKYHEKAFVNFGFLDDDNTLSYFFFNKKLYLWPYSFGAQQEGYSTRRGIVGSVTEKLFDQMITAVAITHPLPNMNASPGDKFLVVATSIEIKVFKTKFSVNNDKIDIIETELVVPTDNDVISKIVQFKKNGRVFYGGVNGHVNELKFDDPSKYDLLSLITGDRKKLKKNDLQEESIISKLLPNFLKINDRKSIVDIKIDEQRNVLYSMSNSLEGNTKDESIIEVFDLGVLSNEFRKIATIRQYAVVEKILDFMRDTSLKGKSIFEVSQNYKIVYMSPIYFSQSASWHLLLVTQNGFRIYISFEQQRVSEPSEDQCYQKGAVQDFLILERFRKNWDIVEILHFPMHSDYVDQLSRDYNMRLIHYRELISHNARICLDSHSVHYDPIDNSIAFFDKPINDALYQQQQHYQDLEQGLILNFITKSEGQHAQARQLLQQGTDLRGTSNFVERFTMIQIANEQPRQQRDYSLVGDHLSDKEDILEIKTSRITQHRNLAKLLGINLTLFDMKEPLASPIIQYLNLSAFETQVYQYPCKYSLMTDRRIYEVQQARPIDILVMVLHYQTRPGQTSNAFDEFEQFMAQYTVRESIAMLIQILSDTNAPYLFNRKIEEYKVKKRESSQQPRQTFASRNLINSPYMNRQGTTIDYRASAVDTYLFRGESVSQVAVFKQATLEVKQLAYQLIRYYGDTLLNTRNDILTIREDNLLGVPTSITQFTSIIVLSVNVCIDKHYGLYLYLSRVLRPIWDMKICYQKSKTDKHLLPTFDSLQVPKLKLQGLLDLIQANPTLFFGESDDTSQECFFKLKELEQQSLFVQCLSNHHRKQLEIMERNSLDNLKVFILRSIQAIDLLDILTFNSDQKLFRKLTSIMAKDMRNELTNYKFSDFVNANNNNLIRKILDLSFEIDYTNGEGGQMMSQAQITARSNKVYQLCNSFFTHDERKAFNGEVFLKRATKERNLEQKEKLLKEGIKALAEQPLKIDLHVIPQLLIENGNYTSLADLILRKIKALQSLSLSERPKYFGEKEYQEQLEDCYGCVLALFAAIDQSITKDYQGSQQEESDYFEFFLKKLNAIQNNEKKFELMVKILQRVQLFEDNLLLISLFDYLISKPSNRMYYDLLPQIPQHSLEYLIDQVLDAPVIQKQKLDSMVTLLLKQREATKLATLVLQVCQESKKVQDLSQTVFPLSIQDKQKYLKKALFVLEDVQKQTTKDYQTSELLKQLQSLDQQIILQIEASTNIDDLLDGIKQNKRIENEWKDLNEKFKINKQEISSKVLNNLDLQQLIESNQLYDTLLNVEMKQSTFMKSGNTDRMKIIINNLIQQTYEVYSELKQQQWKLKITYKIDKLVNNKDMLKYAIEVVQGLNQQHYQHKDVKEDLEVLNSGGKIQDTRFWLIEVLFNTEKYGLPPFEIFTLFNVNGSFDLNHVCYTVAALHQWLKCNNELFKGQSFDMSGSKHQLYLSQNQKEIFVADLKKHGAQVYNSQILTYLQRFFDDYEILLKKEVSQLLKELYNRISRDFEHMLTQHSIVVAAQQRSPFKQPIVNQQRSLNSSGIANQTFTQRLIQQSTPQSHQQLNQSQSLNRSLIQPSSEFHMGQMKQKGSQNSSHDQLFDTMKD